MRRRDFLKRTGAIGAGAAAGLSGLPRIASGASAIWGQYPNFAQAALLPPEKRAKNVLDVFLYGGLSPWESFYVVPEYGTPEDPTHANQQWWTFQSGPDSVENVYNNCFGDGKPAMLQPFAIDDNGKQVHLGPFSEPLRSRTDIVSRLRMHVVTHTLEPHEAAIPYAMSGFRLGQPKLAGLGAAIQHYYQAQAPIITGEPYAYVLYSPGDFPTDNLRAASAIGLHPGSSRPLAIRVESNTSFIDALKRDTVSSVRPQFDALVNHYRQAYRNRLLYPGAVESTRSQTMSDYDFSIDTLQQTDALVDILAPEYFSGIAGSQCGQNSSNNFPRMGFQLAAHLLTRENSKAKYINVVDGGLIPASGGGGYDTHSKHVRDSGRNLKNLWTELISIINEPGENDPNKLNLDETLICINTEFGRTPWPQNGDGRNHHPYAYVTLMFGGPVTNESQGIVGAIGSNGFASGALHPAESRAAILSALGIYPFAPECYAVSDVYGAGSETDAGIWLNEMVLGVSA